MLGINGRRTAPAIPAPCRAASTAIEVPGTGANPSLAAASRTSPSARGLSKVGGTPMLPGSPGRPAACQRESRWEHRVTALCGDNANAARMAGRGQQAAATRTVARRAGPWRLWVCVPRAGRDEWLRDTRHLQRQNRLGLRERGGRQSARSCWFAVAPSKGTCPCSVRQP